MNRRETVLAMLALGAAPGVCAQAEWPKAKPVTLIVGFAPGSTADIVSRVIAQKLGETSGAAFVVENKPGAGGNIATGQVKRSAPDGYTVLAHSVAFAVNPLRCRRSRRKIARDRGDERETLAAPPRSSHGERIRVCRV